MKGLSCSNPVHLDDPQGDGRPRMMPLGDREAQEQAARPKGRLQGPRAGCKAQGQAARPKSRLQGPRAGCKAQGQAARLHRPTYSGSLHPKYVNGPTCTYVQAN